jgi:adenylate cyclase
VKRELHDRLAALGADDDELARAEQEQWLPLLALDHLLMPGPATHDVLQVSEIVGVDPDLLRQLWRALGFPDVPDDLPVFRDEDVTAARTVLGGRFASAQDTPSLLRDIRTISAAMARIAGVLSDYLGERVQGARVAGATDDEIADELLEGFDLGELRLLIDYELRLELRAAAWRRLAFDTAPDISVGVGFADLSGYTRLTSGLPVEEVSELVTRWEAVSYDTAASHATRVVKTIGDEVMFVGAPDRAAETALALVNAVTRAGLPPVRIGLAAGRVIPRGGDFFGPVVNLASRITAIAPEHSVLAPADIRNELPGDRFSLLQFGLVELRGIGEVELVAISSAGSVPA